MGFGISPTTASKPSSTIYHNFVKENLNIRHSDSTRFLKLSDVGFGKSNSESKSKINLNWSHPVMEKSSIKKRTAIDDIVSKNISLVLENLLKSYENSQLPTHNEGKLFVCFLTLFE